MNAGSNVFVGHSQLTVRVRVAIVVTTEEHNEAPFFPLSYGVIHGIVDAVTVTVVFAALSIHSVDASTGYQLVILYNLLAFAGQAPIGYFSDRTRSTRSMVLGGIVCAWFGVALVNVEPVIAIGVVGIGNALFHVGAGALSLYVTPGRAAAPGIFVGPGALGLGLGTWMGKNGIVYEWPMLAILALAFVFALFSRNPVVPYEQKPRIVEVNRGYLIMGLMLFSVAVRSAVGMAGSYECPRTHWAPAAFALAACAGKSLGGALSDRVGWTSTSVGALLISAPLIAFLGTSPVALAAGIFFLQMTMPVTLVAIASIIPGRPGFAFGLACLLLFLGALPTFYAPTKTLYSPGLFFVLILLSAASVYIGLRLLQEEVPMRFPRGAVLENLPLRSRGKQSV
jgi:FSR family fosmidomycin resistance protein-like MFS transporter